MAHNKDALRRGRRAVYRKSCGAYIRHCRRTEAHQPLGQCSLVMSKEIVSADSDFIDNVYRRSVTDWERNERTTVFGR